MLGTLQPVPGRMARRSVRAGRVRRSPDRDLRAFFRARLVWLQTALQTRERLLVRLLPALLHARFPTHGLDGEPLGLVGAKATVGWSRVAQKLELPVPNGLARLSQALESVWVLHTVAGLEVLVLPGGTASVEELARVQRRVTVMGARLAEMGFALPLHFRVLVDAEVTRDVRLQERMILFGALVHGPLPTAWAASTSPAPSPSERLKLAELAPSPLTRLALLLSSAAPLEAPLTVWREALSEGLPARTLAHPSLGLALWLGRGHLEATALIRALAWNPGEDRSGAFRARALLGEADAMARPETLAEEAHRLTRALIGARRPHRGGDRARAQRLLLDEVMPQGFPRVLLPVLRTLLEGSASHWAELESASGVELRDASGFVLARARSGPQAWARAVVLVHRALGKSPFSPDVQGVWRAVAAHALRGGDGGVPAASDTLLLGIRALDLEGGPGDPLNRGEQRLLGFEPGLRVRLRSDRRAAARKASAEELVRAVTSAPREGYVLEIHAETPQSQPAVSRLRRLAELAAHAHREGLPLAVQSGGLLVRTHAGARAPSLAQFARRPVRVCVDSEGPDLAVFKSPRRAYTPPHPEEVHVFLTLAPASEGEAHACVLYTDSAGYHLRETVPLRWLDAHLDDAQTILRAGVSPLRLLLRADENVEEAVQRATTTELAPLELELHGELPFQVKVMLGGELFGAGGALGWEAAAQTVLSHWQPGLYARIRVNRVAVWVAGAPVQGLLALYVRSMAVRRLSAQMRRSERA